MLNTFRLFPLFIIFFSCYHKNNELKVAPLFSDGMVLQRNTMVDIWGKSSSKVEIDIHSEWGQKLKIKPDSDGSWGAKLSTPNAGGPYYLKINSDKESILIKDVLIGEVWLASGQSNMEMPLKGYPPSDTILNFKEEILNANYPFIRMFNVQKQFSIDLAKDFRGSWLEASPIHIENFSSTAYFFAKEVHKKLDIPIGIIHSSWGGSPCESWTSQDKLHELGMFKESLKEMNRNVPKNVIDKWFGQFNYVDIPKQKDFNDRLEKEYEELDFNDNKLNRIDYNDMEWRDVMLPGRFDSLVSSNFDGVVWFRKNIFIENVDLDYSLHIGSIDDMDKTYINGNYIGGMNGWGFWNKKRIYKIPKSFLKEGKNQIAIRSIDTGGPGRFEGVMNIYNNLGDTIPINGLWKYCPVAEIYNDKIYIYGQGSSLKDRPSFLKLNPFMPSVLYNSMIYPLIPYTIKGVIWYQGESNIGRHDEYSLLFPGMIKDWRSRWQNDFPFYFVQIAPFKYTEEMVNHQSQFLRDSQRKSLKLKNTGMVVTLDIGDFSNIHPANKQEVGMRLARLALVNEYGSNLNPLGPILTLSSTEKSNVELEFEHVGSGLKLKQSKVNEFEIAGGDMEFFKANTFVTRNKLILSSKNVTLPKYVRYAWSDTPKATLFNSDDFPASSFLHKVD